MEGSMNFIIPITVILTTGLFTLFAGNGKAGASVRAGIVGLILSSAYIYFLMPALTPVGIIQSLAVASAAGGSFGLIVSKPSFISGVGVAAGILVFAFTVLMFILAPALSAQTLYSLPNVSTHQESNISLVSSDHIREVSEETAVWRADKVVGDLGYKVGVGTMNIQSVSGSLVWLAPLDYNGFWKSWSYRNQGTGGYVIVQAEEAKAPAVLVDNISLRYTDNAFLWYNLQRDIYMDYPGVYIGEHTFQLDDKGNPAWVTMISNPAVFGIYGDVPKGVVITSPLTGSNTFYAMNNVPLWVERVMDERITEKYLEYWGEYKHGFWNTIFGQEDFLVPTGGLHTQVGTESGSVTISQSDTPDVYLVRGTDGRLYWFGSFTTVGKDSSMVGYMLTDLRTGNFNFYPTPSIYNDIGAAKNVQQNPEVAKVMGATVAQPIMYMINGEEIWIMPVITQSGENIMMGVVRARTGETFVSPDLKTALAELNGNIPESINLPGTGSATSLDGIINNLTITLNQLRQYRAAHPDLGNVG
jgi:hypothetical protein